MRETNRSRFAFVCQGDVSDDLLNFLKVKSMETCVDDDGTRSCYLNLIARIRVSRLLSTIDVWNRKPDTAKLYINGNVDVFSAVGVPSSPILTRIHDERRKTLARMESTYRTWTRAGSATGKSF
jgi:hypothetical protein